MVRLFLSSVSLGRESSSENKLSRLEIWLIYPLLPFHTLLGSRGCEVPLRHPSPVSPQRNNGHRKPPRVCSSSSSSMSFVKFIGSHNFAISPRED